MDQTSLTAIFLTGLFAGGLSCMAVQGGLLAATIAQREQEKLERKLKDAGNALPIISFLIAKLVAYTILGLILGWVGSVLQLSLTVKIIMQVFVAIFMIGTALSILNVHPFFHYFIIQPPRFLTRMIRRKSKSGDLFAPALLGVFTIFVPCGVTQAMIALAIASGSSLSGAAIMFAFVLGTTPIFFILGYFTAKLGDYFHQKFMRLVAFAIIILAIFNLNNSIALTGSSFTLENAWQNIVCTVSWCNLETSAAGLTASNNVTITIDSNGYSPNRINIKAGEQITVNLVNKGGGGCAQAFTIPSYGIQRVVANGMTDKVTFTAPESGDVSFMCSMGMFRGSFHVI